MSKQPAKHLARNPPIRSPQALDLSFMDKLSGEEALALLKAEASLNVRIAESSKKFFAISREKGSVISRKQFIERLDNIKRPYPTCTHPGSIAMIQWVSDWQYAVDEVVESVRFSQLPSTRLNAIVALRFHGVRRCNSPNFPVNTVVHAMEEVKEMMSQRELADLISRYGSFMRCWTFSNTDGRMVKMMGRMGMLASRTKTTKP